MSSTARLLEVLSILQAGGARRGGELAERLGVTERTIRRDIDRLRALGYAIDGRRGAHGSYSLGAGGTAVPPLLLDRDEAIAVAVCVRAAAGGAVRGVEEAAERALGKLRQSLPQQTRARVDSLAAATVRIPTSGQGAFDESVLSELTRACRAPERVTFAYHAANGVRSDRRVEPYRVVNVEHRWYLVAHDLDRRAWRTFRLDRISEPRRTGHGVDLPDPPDPVRYVRDSISIAPYPFEIRAVVHAPAAAVVSRVPPRSGVVEELDERSCRLVFGADGLDWAALELGTLGFDFTLEQPDELRAHMAAIAARLGAAAVSP